MTTTHRVVLDTIRSAREADYPDAPAWAYGFRVPDRVTGPTLLVWPVTVARTRTATRTRFVTTTLEVWILTPHQREDAADDALDPLVTDLVSILEATPLVTWETLDRGVLDDKFHGWRTTVTVAHALTQT